MEKQLSVAAALTQWLLKEHRSPIVSLYDIGAAILKIYQAREYGGQKIKNLRTPIPRRESVFNSRKELLALGILEERRELPSGCFLAISSPFQESLDLACGIDPFCYASHLSAMVHHGLTDRFSKTTFITTLPPQQWKIRSAEKMKRDLGEDLYHTCIEAAFPILTKHTFESLNRTPVNVLSTKFADQGAYVNLSDRPARVSSIGRTFIDMLRKPDLCGGMRHVIEVYKEHALGYLPLIVSEVDRHGDKIEKVRAGYILEVICGIENNTVVNSWVAFAQRGGSRVLDPSEAYWPTFSEKWCLSINVPGVSDE